MISGGAGHAYTYVSANGSRNGSGPEGEMQTTGKKMTTRVARLVCP